MAVAVLDDRAREYVKKEDTTSYIVLDYGEIDPRDTFLRNIVSHGVSLSVPPYWSKNGHAYWSQCIDGVYLQNLINYQIPLSDEKNRHRHRMVSQFREMRDFSFFHPGLDNSSVVFRWIGEQAERFAQEYEAMFGSGGLIEKIDLDFNNAA